MWLYIPSTPLSCAPVAGCSALEPVSASKCSAIEPVVCVTSSGKPTLRPLSWRGWKTRLWINRLSGMTLAPSTAARGMVSWIASLRESRAKETALPGNAYSATTREIAGRERGESFATLIPDCSSSKTFTASLFPTESTTEKPQPYGCSKSWPKTGGMRSGLCFLRPEWKPTINDGGFSFWPTIHGMQAGNGPDGNEFSKAVRLWPTSGASDGKRGGRDYTDKQKTRKGGQPAILSYDAANFPPSPWGTPRATDEKGAGQLGDKAHKHRLERDYLDAQVVSFPEPRATATARDSDKCSHPRRDGDKTLTTDAKTFPSSPQPETTSEDGSGYSALMRLLCRLYGVSTEAEFRAAPKQLNPDFVDFLMGWPKGWSSALIVLGLEEMASWRCKVQSLLLSFGYAFLAESEAVA